MADHRSEGPGFEACSGCGVCMLVCPLWRRTGSMAMTRKARARAMQSGADYVEISHSIDACLLCASCEPACPEGIGVTAMNLRQRQSLNLSRENTPSWYPAASSFPAEVRPVSCDIAFLPGERLSAEPELMEQIFKLLGGTSKAERAEDDGRDIAAMIEAGLPVSEQRRSVFAGSLRKARTVVAAEGIMHRLLRSLLPGKKITGVGEALLDIPSVRGALGFEDMYVIESRAYHSDFERLVKYYDRLKRDTGCQLNLDLQRIAIPTGAAALQSRRNPAAAGCVEQAKWILSGRSVRRIVVEDISDLEVFRSVCDLPVVHVGALVRIS